MTFLVAAAFLLGGSAAPQSVPGQKTSKGMAPLFTVGIQPVGTVSTKDIERVVEGVKRWWVNVKVLPKATAPDRFRLSSGRYQAEPWANLVSNSFPKGVDKLLVITSVGLSDRREGTDDWRVLGYSVPKGRVAIISQSMLVDGYRTSSEKLNCTDLTLRLGLHELARSFGVEECHWTKCLSYPHRGSVKRLGETMEQFCPRCSNTLWQVGVII